MLKMCQISHTLDASVPWAPYLTWQLNHWSQRQARPRSTILQYGPQRSKAAIGADFLGALSANASRKKVQWIYANALRRIWTLNSNLELSSKFTSHNLLV